MDRLVNKASKYFITRSNLKKPTLPTKWNPDIVISRDPGSGGRVIARRLARKLGWKLLDKQILTKLAEELNIPAKEFAKIDEHTRNWFADTINSIFNPNYVSDIRYLKHLKTLLMKNAKEGDVVIVGRGANHILPADKCLRVRVTASFSNRVKNTMKHEKMKKDDATNWVRYVQTKRSNFIRQYFGVNPHNSWHYDLVINTDNFSLAKARDLIIQAYLAKFPAEKKRLQDKI